MISIKDFENTNPNIVGEFLREKIFPEGFGCYSSFEPIEEAEEIRNSGYIDYIVENCYGGDEKYRAGIHAWRIPAGVVLEEEIIVFCYWDGDGFLEFHIEDFYYYNTDCKKNTTWEKPGF